ncbi:MAG: ankyrin repeat domain-containing protein [Gammaproteobacteria bacterium]|nr:ankyrin repeat domain-containing protein [Gammaproteobacteria bacterium]
MVLLRESPLDWALVGVVALLVIGANLPTPLIEVVNFDRRYFVIGLALVVCVALVRYLKFALLLLVFLLAVGANLPEELAKTFNIDPQIMLLALLAMVVVSLSNKIWKLPTGNDKKSRSPSLHGAAALFGAVLKGRIAIVQTLLKQGVNVNTRTVTGKTPLMAAAYKGYSDIVQLLLDNGAEANARDTRGDSALKMAERGGYSRIVQTLRASGAAD